MLGRLITFSLNRVGNYSGAIFYCLSFLLYQEMLSPSLLHRRCGREAGTFFSLHCQQMQRLNSSVRKTSSHQKECITDGPQSCINQFYGINESRRTITTAAKPQSPPQPEPVRLFFNLFRDLQDFWKVCNDFFYSTCCKSSYYLFQRFLYLLLMSTTCYVMKLLN